MNGECGASLFIIHYFEVIIVLRFRVLGIGGQRLKDQAC